MRVIIGALGMINQGENSLTTYLEIPAYMKYKKIVKIQ